LFQKRENIQRKIQLHAPLYLIKKVFISAPRASLKQSVHERGGDDEENVGDEEEGSEIKNNI